MQDFPIDMRDYSEYSTEELENKYSKSCKLEDLVTFNSASDRRKLEIESCFLKAELIRRGIDFNNRTKEIAKG